MKPVQQAQNTLSQRGILRLESNGKKVVKVGVIGYGYWGPKLVRNFQELSQSRVTMIADLDPVKLDRASVAHPEVELTDDYFQILNSDVDAVCIATPVSTHCSIARDALQHGKHVLVEKPLGRGREEVEGLIELADGNQRVLMAGHTYEYNPAVEMLKDIVASGEIGRVYYAYSVRTNLGIFQKDVNVMWDLAPHDISILLYVLGIDPVSVSARGEAYIQPRIHDVVHLSVQFPDQIQGLIHVSWLDPCKVRRLTIVGDKKMVVYDDIETTEKIRLYDKGVGPAQEIDSYGEFQLSYRYGNITIPQVPAHEPLKLECAHFADCILLGRQPRTSGQVGLKVVKVLESAQESLLDGGSCKLVKW